MNPAMELAIIVIAAILFFEFAALRWGVDSRDLLRDHPFQHETR
jgi:hypothetical protein